MTTFYFTIENARSFANPRPIRVAPLTIFVGENSAGKSSALGLLRATLESTIYGDLPNFNQDPFFLGAYDQIAHYRGGSAGRAKSFSLGLTMPAPPPRKKESNRTLAPLNLENDLTLKVRSQFSKAGSQPSIKKLYAYINNIGLIIDYEKDSEGFYIDDGSRLHDLSRIFPERNLRHSQFRPRRNNLVSLSIYLEDMLYFSNRSPQLPLEPTHPNVTDFINRIPDVIRSAFSQMPTSIYASAPVRTRPERTYDPVDDGPGAEGKHVPMLLARLKRHEPKRWEEIRAQLDHFGQMTGLFKSINVKDFGKSDSDPFQIMVKVDGPQSNLIDVGYGISQVLPVITDLVLARKSTMYIFQQPEVHLHPKAQAALGTIFANYAQKNRPPIVLETHSDFLIDRVRLAVRDGTLQPDDVSIVYFERAGLSSNIINLELDKKGRILDVPSSYRDFFVNESIRMLS